MIGALREYLSGPPSQMVWEQLWQLFSGWRGGDLEVGIEYAREHLSTWPASLLAPPLQRQRHEPYRPTLERWQLELLQTLRFSSREELFSHLEEREQPLWGLELHEVELKQGDFEALAQMPALGSLSHLRLSSCDWQSLGDWLESGLLGGLSSIGFVGVYDSDAPHLIELIRRRKALAHIRQLELSFGLIYFSHGVDLFHGDARGAFDEVQTLLVRDALTADAFGILIHAVAEGHFPKLTALQLPMGESIASSAGDGSPMELFELPWGVEVFSMSHTAFSEGGFNYLCDGIPASCKVRELYFSSVTVEEDYESDDEDHDGGGDAVDPNGMWGVQSIMDTALTQVLEVLHFADNGLNDASLVKLSGIASLQEHLRELDVSRNAFTAEGLSAICEKLEALEVLILNEKEHGHWRPEVFSKWLEEASFSPAFQCLCYHHPSLDEANRQALLELAQAKQIQIHLWPRWGSQVLRLY